MIEKKTKITDTTISEYKIIFWKEVTEIIEDGKVIATQNHRSSVSPDQDINLLPEQLRPLAQALWTPEVIQTYKDKTEAPIEKTL